MAKRTSMIGIKVTEETRDKVEYLAGLDARTVSSYINLVLQKHLDQIEMFNDEAWKQDLEEQRKKKGNRN